jgi:hypothetical protein
MDFNYLHYVPCLRWKQGEYLAIQKLSDIEKKVTTPLIEVPEIGYDFEKQSNSKTIDAHLAPFAKRVVEKWGKLPCFIDMKLIDDDERMSNSDHPVNFIFNELLNLNFNAIPVTGIDRNDIFQKEIKKVVEKDNLNICLRVTIEKIARESFQSKLEKLLKLFGLDSNEVHFILDLGTPNFLPLDSFARLIQKIIIDLPHLANWKTFTILATSFPESMGVINKGICTIPRYEWQLYRKLITKLNSINTRLPSFGDNAIANPKVLTVDMRIVSPAATIRYTVDDNWCIVKGESIRKGKKYKQFHELCQLLISSKYFDGPTFSYGDNYIKLCAEKNKTSGNLTTWRKIGTNHHIIKVIRDIANFYAVLGIQ